MYMTHKNIW